MNKQISKVWTFSSDSNPNIEYETLQYMEQPPAIARAGLDVWPQQMAAAPKHLLSDTRKAQVISGVS